MHIKQTAQLFVGLSKLKLESKPGTATSISIFTATHTSSPRNESESNEIIGVALGVQGLIFNKLIQFNSI